MQMSSITIRLKKQHINKHLKQSHNSEIQYHIFTKLSQFGLFYQIFTHI